MQPKLIVEQRITAFVNQYRIYDVDDHGKKKDLVAFAHQKRLAFKEKVWFYADEQKSQELFSFRAEKVLDVHGRYFVEDTTGHVVGAFKKAFQKSLINSTWYILDGDEPALTISESSKVLAILRRFIGLLPYVGDVADLFIKFFRYHFVFADSATGQEVGRYEKTTLFRDHYQLVMTDEAYRQQDWRVLAAMAVALDALQSR